MLEPFTLKTISLLPPWICHLAPCALLSWSTSTRQWNSPFRGSFQLAFHPERGWFLCCTNISFPNISGDCIDDLPARSTIWSLGWTTTTQHSGYPATQGTPNIPPITKNDRVPHVEPNPSYHPEGVGTCLFLVLFQPSTNGYITTRDNKDSHNIFHLLSSYLSAVDACWAVRGRNDSAPPPSLICHIFCISFHYCAWKLCL